MAIKKELLITLIAVTCYKCGLVFGIEEDHRDNLIKTGEEFFCPSGHGQVYGIGKIKELENKLHAESEAKKWWMNHSDAQKQETESVRRQLSATKGVLTKTKNKIAKGTCPCCKHKFVSLAKHMTKQHPFYATQEEAE